ncbi:MAG: 23S rRNA (uracil(1939)-C(5))-methyltransferase RlmD [Herpetosiphon sp.]
MQDRGYNDQLAAKRTALLEIMGQSLPDAIMADYEVEAAPEELGYRLRMDYVCSDDRFGLRQRKRFYAVLDLLECHLIPPALFQTVRDVYGYIRSLGVPDYNVYHNTGFLRYLVVRRNVRDEWILGFVAAEQAHEEQVADVARYAMQRGARGMEWILNSRQGDTSFGETIGRWGDAYLPQYVAGQQFLIGLNTFFQNNVRGFEQILAFCVPYVAGARRLVDLYAGVGTIGLTLGKGCDEVVAVELVPDSVALLHRNIALNPTVGRVEVVEGDVLRVLDGFAWRAGDVGIVDPPRAGLLPETAKRLREVGPQRIVYVSCNAVTQAMDLAILNETYEVVAARGFDLFPQTLHCEQVVVLDRRGAAAG